MVDMVRSPVASPCYCNNLTIELPSHSVVTWLTPGLGGEWAQARSALKLDGRFGAKRSFGGEVPAYSGELCKTLQ